MDIPDDINLDNLTRKRDKELGVVSNGNNLPRIVKINEKMDGCMEDILGRPQIIR